MEETRTSDRGIRDKLLENLRANKENLKVINELDLNSARIDIAIINKDFFCGYEIKSDRDTLRRLSMQIQIYGYVLDKITIVVGISKLFKVNEMIPDFWGIIMARKRNGQVILKEVRKPKQNTNINKGWLSQKLWRSDIVKILKLKDLYKGKSRYYRDNLARFLMENISLDELRYYIRNILINRIY